MPSLPTSKRKLIHIDAWNGGEEDTFEIGQSSVDHRAERDILGGSGVTSSLGVQEELIDEWADISSDDDSPPMIHPCRRRRALETEDIGGGEESGNEGSVDLLRGRVGGSSAAESDGEESEERGEVGIKEVESLVQGSGVQEDDEEQYERERQSGRRTAIKFLESIPLTIMSQLVTTLTIENRSLKSLAGSDVERKNGDDVEGEEMEEESEVLEWGVDIPMMDRATGNMKHIKFPRKGSKTSAAKNLASLLRVSELLHQALLEDIVITKRDIFYKDVELFKRQSVVDELVDTLVASAKLTRANFNVCATAKGLVAASGVELVLRSGQNVHLGSERGTLIPSSHHILRINFEKDLKWVLMVEKDAVFQTLCSTAFAQSGVLGPGMIVTGKGYPDLATKQFLTLLANKLPNIPFFGLVDADPFGLDILSVYMNGSQKSRMAADHDGLALGDRLKWLGVKATEWKDLRIRPEDLLPLSDKDHSFALSMLRTRPELPDEWKRELCYMLHLHRKAEIQILCQTPIAAQERASQHLDETAHSASSDEDDDDLKTGASRICPIVTYLEAKMSNEMTK